MRKAAICLVASAFFLSACGDTKQERVTSGAIIGAGVGAGVGLAAGAPILGAFVGTGTGMLVGGLTTPQVLDWGPMDWPLDGKNN